MGLGDSGRVQKSDHVIGERLEAVFRTPSRAGPWRIAALVWDQHAHPVVSEQPGDLVVRRGVLREPVQAHHDSPVQRAAVADVEDEAVVGP
jgi:hypothetical protein